MGKTMKTFKEFIQEKAEESIQTVTPLIIKKLNEIGDIQVKKDKILKDVTKTLVRKWGDPDNLNDDDIDQYDEEESELLLKKGYFKLKEDWKGLGELIKNHLKHEEQYKDLVKGIDNKATSLKAINKIASTINKGAKNKAKVRFMF
jgi:hypothetical protein